MSAARVMAVQRMFRHASTVRTLDGYSGLFDDDLSALAERADPTHDGLVTKRLWAPAEDRDLAWQRHAGLRVLARGGGLEPATQGSCVRRAGCRQQSATSAPHRGCRSDGWAGPHAHALVRGRAAKTCPPRVHTRIGVGGSWGWGRSMSHAARRRCR
jgi:hypothetical protein